MTCTIYLAAGYVEVKQQCIAEHLFMRMQRLVEFGILKINFRTETELWLKIIKNVFVLLIGSSILIKIDLQCIQDLECLFM